MAEFPSSLPGIDIPSGLARVAGNKKLFVKLLRHVAADAASIREKLFSAIGEGNAQAVREIAHSLKATSSNLSLTEVAAAAERLEAAAKAEDFASLPERRTALETALDAFVAVVATLEGR